MSLAAIYVFVVPRKQVRRGVSVAVLWQPHDLPVQLVILLTVVKFFPYPRTDLDPMARRNGHVAPVKERVQVLAKQDAVRGRMCPTRRIWSDVSGFEHMQYRGVGESTSPLV